MTKYNFLFDLIASQPNLDGDFHGGGKYAKRIFISLLEHNNENSRWTILGLYDSRKKIDDETKRSAEQHNIRLVDINVGGLLYIVKELQVKRFYSSLPFGIIKKGFWDLSAESVEVYTTIHGLRTLETQFPWSALDYYSSLKDKLKESIRKIWEKKLVNRDKDRYQKLTELTRINAVSNHTKYSILTFFPNYKSDIPVFYSPDVTDFSDQNEEPFDIPSKSYFLMVSGNRWLKNNLNSAVALDQLFTDRPGLTYNVIITGVSNPGIYISKIKNKDRFIFYKYVSESMLKQLYQNAFGFLYLSLNEGFGYPPLEAMKFGVPVIACPFTSVSEVCQDAVLYSNPNSIPEIKSRLYQVLDPVAYEDLSIKSKNRYLMIKKRQEEDLQRMINYLLND